jgi:hypothetical protein
MVLPRKELERLTEESVDRLGTGPYINLFENIELTNSELANLINQRNIQGKNTYKLRAEYERRLSESESDSMS